jgi:hypothetical protein
MLCQSPRKSAQWLANPERILNDCFARPTRGAQNVGPISGAIPSFERQPELGVDRQELAELRPTSPTDAGYMSVSD